MYLKRVARGISFSFILIIVGAVLAYFFRRLLATELSIDDYGMFYAMLSFFGFFMLFVDMGVEQAATKKIVELKEQKKEYEIAHVARTILFGQLLVSIFFSIIFFLGKNMIATYYFHNAHVTSFLWILTIWFVTTPLLTFCAYMLLGLQRTTWYTALDVGRMSIVLLFCLGLFQYNQSLYIPVLAYAIINLILFGTTYPYICSVCQEMRLFSKQKWSIHPKAGMEILKYAIPVALTNFGWIILTQTDTIALTYFTTLREVGLYNIALPISLLLLFFMRPVIIIFAPLVTELHTAKKPEKLSEAVTMAYAYLFVLLVPFAVTLALFPEYIIPILFGQKYSEASPALQILAAGTVFYAFSLFNNIVYTGMGQAQKIAKSVALICGLNVLLNILFVGIFHLSISGASLATTICYILLFITSTHELTKHISFEFPLKTWIKSMLFVAISACAVIWIKKIIIWNNLAEAMVCGMVLLLIYGALIVFTKTIDVKKTKELFKKATA